MKGLGVATLPEYGSFNRNFNTLQKRKKAAWVQHIKQGISIPVILGYQMKASSMYFQFLGPKHHMDFTEQF